MCLMVFCIRGLCALSLFRDCVGGGRLRPSLRERAGVRVRTLGCNAWGTLTLTLSRRERGKKVPVIMNVTEH